MPRSRLSALTILLAVSYIGPASAQDMLPYTTRTRPYGAGDTTVRGDIRTVGMAGATVGLADTFIAAVDNPSGLAMTVDVGDDTLTGNSVHDAELQNYDNAMNTGFVGVAVAPYPWGLGIGYVSTYAEGQPYVIPGSSTTDPVPLEVTTREIQLMASRVFFHDRLSLGVTMRVGQAEEDIDLGSNPNTAAFHSYAFGATFGAMWQFPNRWLLGLSYATAMRYSVDTDSVPPTLLPGFFQPVYTPARASFGVGYIPNRFFRTSFALTRISSSPETALLANQDIPVGVNAVWEPRVGASYIFCDYKELRGTAFVGSYYEFTRVAGENDRLHGTAGIELKPWIFTVGWGIDRAQDYENYLFSLSVDVFKIMAKLDVIPTAWHPPYTGFSHSPFARSDVGLARPLVRDWRPHGPDINPFDVGMQLPSKISEKAQEGFGKAQEEFGNIVKSVTGDDEPTTTLVGPPAPSRERKTKPKKTDDSP